MAITREVEEEHKRRRREEHERKGREHKRRGREHSFLASITHSHLFFNKAYKLIALYHGI